MAYKTPGVFTEEINLLPPSVAPVATAVPAFIGYTQNDRGEAPNGLRYRPTRVATLLEYRQLFEDETTAPNAPGGFVPHHHLVVVDATDGLQAILPKNSGDPDDETTVRRFHLYNALRLYFANGGGPCYIVSVGSYSDTIALGDGTTAGLRRGLNALEKYDEPTILLSPDAVELPADQLGAFQAAALQQGAKLKDRFVVMDLRDGFKKATPGNDPVQIFRDNIGTQALNYGAVYHPWLVGAFAPSLRLDGLRIFRAGPPLTDIKTAAGLQNIGLTPGLPPETVAYYQSLVTAYFDRNAEVQAIGAQYVSLPAGMALTNPARIAYQQIVRRFLDDAGLTTLAQLRSAFLGVVRFLQDSALVFQRLDDAATHPSFVVPLNILRSQAELRQAITHIISLEKNTDILNNLMPAGRALADVHADYSILNNTSWVNWPGATQTVDQIAAESTIVVPSVTVATFKARAQEALSHPVFADRANAVLRAVDQLFKAVALGREVAENQLFSNHPWFRGLAARFAREVSLTPPSGAVAGVYATVDRVSGVWKAPANVSLRDISGPAFKIDDLEQGDLNVHSTGKSINAIRTFTGKGTLVWGARTLSGNDNEWRYVPVRRFFLFAEESIKKASEPFVFEPNDANTWVRVKAMIENFLTVQWRAGALAGSTPEKAFYVKLGLGETMTSLDVLEGRMIVEIGLAVVRPAEFIILRFTHKMQES